jgi:hypothetical protein
MVSNGWRPYPSKPHHILDPPINQNPNLIITRGLFGALAMLKTITVDYQYLSLATFKKIKVLFVHTTDRTVYLWSISLAPEGTIYKLWLENLLEIKPDIGDKLEAIPNFLQSYWKMKDLLKETSRMMMELKKEHDSILIENRFKSSSYLNSLSFIVNPSILRLTEEEDKTGMANLGTLFSPKR